MADIKAVIEKAIELAELGGSVFPPLATGGKLAGTVLDLINGLHNEAPDDRSQEQLQEAHDQLYKTMTDKGHALSARLRG